MDPAARPPTEPDVLTPILRKHIVAAMIHLMEAHGQSSISNQLAARVLEQVQHQTDEQDMRMMQEFIRSQVLYNSSIRFESGRETSQMNLGSILNIAFQLKQAQEPTW